MKIVGKTRFDDKPDDVEREILSMIAGLRPELAGGILCAMRADFGRGYCFEFL